MKLLRKTLPLNRARPIMAIGDVHGMTGLLEAALDEAKSASAFPVLLGDLVDKGPDSTGVLRLVLPRLREGTLALVRGNHEERLLRWLANPRRAGKPSRAHSEILAADDAKELSRQAAAVLDRVPYWINLPGYVLVHGAFHPDMLTCRSRGAAGAVPTKLKTLALYAEVDGTRGKDKLPVRTYKWVESIPSGTTVLVGHDTRQLHEPLVVDNDAGGQAIFLDTGAAKGGRLSTWLIPPLRGRAR